MTATASVIVFLFMPERILCSLINSSGNTKLFSLSELIFCPSLSPKTSKEKSIGHPTNTRGKCRVLLTVHSRVNEAAYRSICLTWKLCNKLQHHLFIFCWFVPAGSPQILQCTEHARILKRNMTFFVSFIFQTRFSFLVDYKHAKTVELPQQRSASVVTQQTTVSSIPSHPSTAGVRNTCYHWSDPEWSRGEKCLFQKTLTPWGPLDPLSASFFLTRLMIELFISYLSY